MDSRVFSTMVFLSITQFYSLCRRRRACYSSLLLLGKYVTECIDGGLLSRIVLEPTDSLLDPSVD